MKASHLMLTIAMFVSVSASAAATETAVEFKFEVVPYADLDLTTGVGRAMLDRRIARAVRAVCPADQFRPLSDRARSECMAVAKARAVPQVEVATARAEADRFAGGR